MADDGDKVITLNVAGTTFQARSSLFTAYPTTLLGKVLLSDTADRNKSDFFFDANPRAFESVMDMYRRGTLKCPPDMDPTVFQAELDFWQIPSGDSVHDLLDIEACLFHEATLMNTKAYEQGLVLPRSEEQEASQVQSAGGESAKTQCTRSDDPKHEDTSKFAENSKVARVLGMVDGLSEDLEVQIKRLQGNKRILASVRRALSRFSAGLYEYSGTDWRLLQSAVEETADKVVVQDGHSMDEIMTSVKGASESDFSGRRRKKRRRQHRSAEEPILLFDDDLVLYNWWTNTVGEENLDLFWMPFFVRPDRQRVYVDFSFAYHLKSKADFYEMLDVRGAGSDDESEEAPTSFKLGRVPVDYNVITQHGVDSGWAVEQEDFQNGGHYTLVRYNVPVLRISWAPAQTPSLEQRLQAVLRGEVDPAPDVSVLQSARHRIRSVEASKPMARADALCVAASKKQDGDNEEEDED